MALRFWIRQQRPGVFECCFGISTDVEPLGDGRHHLRAHLVVRPAHRWPQGHQKIVSPCTALLQKPHGLRQDPRGHPTPAGMTGRGMAGAAIRDQNRGAVGTADPEALATAITHQAVGLGPGLLTGFAGLQNDSTVDLLGTMDADASTDVTGQFVGASTLPAAREEPVFKACSVETIALQVIAAVAANPGPALQGVEAVVRSIERIVAFHRHGWPRGWRCHASSRSPRRLAPRGWSGSR